MMEKRLAAVWVVIVLLMTAAAGCETASGFMETEEGSIYPNTTLLTEDSFPQVRLSPHKAFTLFQNSRKEPRYVTFPCPEGARCYRFETDCCYLLIPEEDLQISYQVLTDYSYEAFLDRSECDDYVVLDDPGGATAVIDPLKREAYALVNLDGMQSGARLLIRIRMEGIRGMEREAREQVLTGVIVKEAERVRGSMHWSAEERFWTYGEYRGLRLVSYSVPGAEVLQELPEMTFHLDGEVIAGKPFVVSVNGEDAELYVTEDRTRTIRIQMNVDSFSFVFYKRDASEIRRLTAEDGSEWGYYVSNRRDGKPYKVYASRVLTGKDRHGQNRPVYLNYEISVPLYHAAWPDCETFEKDFRALVSCLHVAGLPEETGP